MKLLSRLALIITLTATSVVAQTKVTPPKNKYTPQQDVEIGREAAAEVRKQYPIINDSQIRALLERLGDRLVEAAPRELNNPVFEYSFTPVNLKDINAFALPGGPMFVNRGMIEAAATEGEVAGVMAHELAHVLLRHGTANATKAQGFQIGALAGAIAGAVIGGGWGEVISQGSQFGLGTWLMKYSREYETAGRHRRRADHGARRIRPARSRAHVRDDSEAGRQRRPRVAEQPPEPRQPHAVHQRRKRRSCASDRGRTTRDSSRPGRGSRSSDRRGRWRKSSASGGAGSGGGRSGGSVGRVGEAVPPPSRQYRTVQGGQLFTVSVPSNWQAVSSNNSIKYVPQNAYGDYQRADRR